MNNFFRTIIAAYGAKKLGGGCFSTILVFFIIYWALGTCNSHPAQHANIKAPVNTVAKVYTISNKEPKAPVNF